MYSLPTTVTLIKLGRRLSRGKSYSRQPSKTSLSHDVPSMTRCSEAVDILLVEDNPGDVRLTKEAFKATDIETVFHTVVDGHEAIEFLCQRGAYETATRPDLVLLDLNLPRKDGFDVLGKIQETPELTHLPVIVLTSSREQEDIRESYKSDANAYLTKPNSHDEFASLARIIEQFWLRKAELPPPSSVNGKK